MVFNNTHYAVATSILTVSTILISACTISLSSEDINQYVGCRVVVHIHGYPYCSLQGSTCNTPVPVICPSPAIATPQRALHLHTSSLSTPKVHSSPTPSAQVNIQPTQKRTWQDKCQNRV